MKFVRELGERMAASERLVVYNSAKMVLDEIKQKLKSPAYADYVDALRLVQIAVEPPAYAIYAKPKRKRLTKLDTNTVVLYVRPKARNMAKIPDYIKVLEQFSPWTMGTIPFIPRKQEAVLIYRTVRENEVNAISKKRNDHRSEWETALTKAGKKPQKPVVFPPAGKAIPDLAFEALRIEFGIGPGAGKSHWRPALRLLAKSGVRRMLSPNSASMRPVVEPAYAGWKTPPQAEAEISTSVAAGFQGFQSKLTS